MPTQKQRVQEASSAAPSGMRLYDDHGHRLYLTGSEREAFRKAAEAQPHGEVRTYCWTLLYTGCRPSEDLAHGIRQRRTRERLWTWSLKTAYMRVIEIMRQAGIDGPHATPKGLRHGFGVACIEKGIPLNLVQRWLGHAQLSTTAIYANAVGEEERGIAARLWASLPSNVTTPPHLVTEDAHG
jgi:integrase/recombinase XerD